MSKGNKIVPVRMTETLLHEIEAQIASRNAVAAGEPWVISDFIRTACQEKLKKMARSRAARKPLTGDPAVDLILPDVVPDQHPLLGQE